MTIDNAIERFRARQRSDAVDRLHEAFESFDLEEGDEHEIESTAPLPARPAARHIHEAHDQPSRDGSLTAIRASIPPTSSRPRQSGSSRGANDQDASELRALLGSLRSAIERRSEDEIEGISREIEDIVFYLEDK